MTKANAEDGEEALDLSAVLEKLKAKHNVDDCIKQKSIQLGIAVSLDEVKSSIDPTMVEIAKSILQRRKN